MADIDLLPPRGVPVLALVDGTGIATNGSQTVAQLAQRGMRSVCAVDATGVSVSGATVAQLAQRGIRAFCPVDETGVAADASTALMLRQRGIRPMVLLGATGIALTGSATMLTLAQRGLGYFCPVDEAGNATTMGAVILVTNTTVLESATIGVNVGVLSVAGGTGTYVFTLTDSAGGKFVCAGTNGTLLNVAAALDYETATSHSITVSANNGGTPITRTIVITVQNVVEDTTPNAFTFTDVTGAALSTVVESNTITVAGIDGPATMTITGGQYQINGGAWASASTTVVATNTVKVRGTSSASSSTAVNVVLTIGGVSDTFTITTASSSLPAPVLVWTSGPSVYDPIFTATYVAAVADILTLEIDDNSDFSSLFDSEANTLDSAEVAAGTVTYAGISTLSGGVTYYARLKLQRGADSVYSNTVSQTMTGGGDTTAPILSSATGTKTGSTTATVTVTTDEANGTLYYVLSGSATTPTAAQIIAGNDHTGSTALKSGSAAVSSTGPQPVNVTGLTASTTYYAHFAHRDAASNSSAPVSSTSFTTDAAATGTTRDVSTAASYLNLSGARQWNTASQYIVEI